ncbi:hypothetical protein V1477_006412 [Vespula maculifrons]|uniref:CMP/dCMP-type deaminase domain-containing protein n=1 Tax=Vespula maculifrons TaxID=7453 RepID=A0ABD2CKC1_VESMC
MGVEGATSPFQIPCSGSRTCYSFGEKNFKKKIFFPLFSLNCYSSATIGPIWTKNIWAQRALRELSNDPGPVLLGAIVSEKKIVKENFSSFVPFKPGCDEPFKRPRSGSSRCYSFGEKNS